MIRPRWLVLALLALLLAGCRQLGASISEKRASFRTVAGQNVAGVPVEAFLKRRVALVFHPVAPVDEDARKYEADIGAATALTPDGYYLTAAHVVNDPPCHLVRLDTRQTYPLRVVWSGWAAGLEGEEELDLALVHADVPPTAYFEWAWSAGLEPETQVVSAGFPELELHFAAGELSPRPGARSFQYPEGLTTTLFYHTVPLRVGDSGGPLATLDGELVGVNTQAIFGRWIHDSLLGGTALRPEPAWLRSVIERDRRARLEGSTLILAADDSPDHLGSPERTLLAAP